MKHILTIVLLLITFTVAAQNYSPCYTNNITKGDMAYNQGRYKDAKTYYQNALKCPDGNPAEAKRKINQCEAKLNPPPKPPKPSQSNPAPKPPKPSPSNPAPKPPKTSPSNPAPKPQPDTSSYNPAPKIKFSVTTDAEGNQIFTVNDVTFKMIYVQGGTFTMGCTSEQNECYKDEKPKHNVTVSDFLMGETEVTQALWEAVMGTTVREQRDKVDPSWPMYGEGASHPMYYVSWDDCQKFIQKLNQLTGKTFRLPTEAEWEYAARGGNKSLHYKYAGSDILDDVAWYDNNSKKAMHPVKTKRANELGLYDMNGNVWEWCSDWYGKYSSSSQTNPKGPSSGSERVLRGGGIYDSYGGFRLSYRVRGLPYNLSYCSNNGFRLVLVQQ